MQETKHIARTEYRVPTYCPGTIRCLGSDMNWGHETSKLHKESQLAAHVCFPLISQNNSDSSSLSPFLSNHIHNPPINTR